MASTCNENPTVPAGARAGLLVARLVMGGLFLFSGAAKLGWVSALKSIGPLEGLGRQGIDPAAFAGTIKGFRILHPDLIPAAAFALPWLEVVCAAALIIGLGTRGAARIVIALLLIFCAAMISVIVRDIDVDCTCFGKFLGGAVDWLSIARNVALMAVMWPVAKWGAGTLALEHAVMRRPAQA